MLLSACLISLLRLVHLKKQMMYIIKLYRTKLNAKGVLFSVIKEQYPCCYNTKILYWTLWQLKNYIVPENYKTQIFEITKISSPTILFMRNFENTVDTFVINLYWWSRKPPVNIRKAQTSWFFIAMGMQHTFWCINFG